MPVSMATATPSIRRISRRIEIVAICSIDTESIGEVAHAEKKYF